MPAYNNASPNTSNNYTYTQIGELKSDNQEEIHEIHWRVDSKISEITRTSGSSKKNLKFEYDAMGNRVAKHVYAGSVLESSTYYVRDAQGNVMGVYEHKMDAENAVMEYKLIERNIYGSAQVGICKDTVDLNITNAAGALTQATYYRARQLNHRQYSLSNHLGNVLTTIGDGKAPVDSNSDGVIDYYTAYIISVSDYSPFGVELASRSWSIEEYRNGFNGKEKVNEITGNSSDYDFGARIYDARIGRWMSRDAFSPKYPGISPYVFVVNSPLYFKDPDGNNLKPTTTFESSSLNVVLNNLVSNNVAFKKYLGKCYDNEAFNVTFDINNSAVSAGKIARTDYNFRRSFDKNGKAYTSALEATISFREDLDYYNDFGQAILIAHEYLHAYAGLQLVGGEDVGHQNWDNYITEMKEIVKEFGVDNGIILDDKQIYELSIYNVGPGGKVFDDYISGLATKNNTTIDEEQNSFYSRVDEIVTKNSENPFIEEGVNEKNTTED